MKIVQQSVSVAEEMESCEPTTIGLTPMDAFIDIRDVSLTYAKGKQAFRAINDVTMGVKEGEFVAIVGPSGCGKSSLLKLISGLRAPSKGTIEIGGVKVTGPTGICGLAFQNAKMLPWRTTLQNVMLPLEITETGIRSHRKRTEVAKRRAHELLQRVNLSEFEDRYPWELSGGMLQRASLCRTLVHGPRILLLDEPFGALDAFTREELWSTLQSLFIEQRPTIVLVTHDLREAVFLADVIYVFSPGPGHIISHTGVNAIRPRSVQDTYAGETTAMIRKLHNQIQRG